MGKVDFTNAAAFRAKVNRAVNNGLTAAARAAAKFAKIGMSRGGRHVSSAPGTPPNVQRGTLRNSITHTRSVAFSASMGVPINVPYGAIHEFGGTIYPKSSRYLPVPVNVQAKRAMEVRGTPRGLDLVPIRSRGRLFLVPKPGRRGARRSGPVFALKSSVRIPPRPFLWSAVAKNQRAIWSEARIVAANTMRGGR